jgi:predicted nucleic acid-binding protein
LRAISNSSVLIALSSIGQLSVLTQRFPHGILIPQAVWYEVVETGGERVGAKEVAAGLNSWLTVQDVENKTLVLLLQQDLDNGEAEAVALFYEQPSEALLLDEKKARQVSRRMVLPVIGTLGLLIWARRQDVIPNLQEQLDALRTLGKFHLS